MALLSWFSRKGKIESGVIGHDRPGQVSVAMTTADTWYEVDVTHGTTFVEVLLADATNPFDIALSTALKDATKFTIVAAGGRYRTPEPFAMPDVKHSFWVRCATASQTAYVETWIRSV